MGGQLSTQIILNFIAVYLLRFVETSQLPLLKNIQEDAMWVKRSIILLFSTLTAAGLVFHFEIQTGDFTMSGNIWSLLHAFRNVAQNYAGITGMYWGKCIFDYMKELRPILKQMAIQQQPTGTGSQGLSHQKPL